MKWLWLFVVLLATLPGCSILLLDGADDSHDDTEDTEETNR